jgi:transcriptional regulator with XRE-family HTH domain
VRNERLAKALAASSLTRPQLAGELGVDPKTIERWVAGGRTPYPRHRARVAALLGEDVDELWSEVSAAEDGLSGQWWAAWQSYRVGTEVTAVQPVRISQRRDLIRWEATERGRPVKDGGYLWAGSLRLVDGEVLMGHYSSIDPPVRSKGTVFLVLHPQGRVMAGRWIGLSHDGYFVEGWGALAREEPEVWGTITDLIHNREQPWMRSFA